MNILWVRWTSFDEALDRTTWLEMINELETLGHRVTLLTSYRKKKLTFGLRENLIYIPHIDIKVLRIASFLLFSYFRILLHILIRKPHIVILDIWTFWLGFPLDVFSKLRLIQTKFVIDMRTFYYGVNKDKLSLKDLLVKIYTNIGLIYNDMIHSGISVITNELKREILFGRGKREDSVCVWTSGVSIDKFRIGMYVAKPDLEGKFVVMQHGEISHNRGLYEIILAINLLRDHYPNIILFLLGSGHAEKMLKKTIQELHLQEKCILHQPVDYNEIPQYLANCNVGIMAYPKIKYWQVNNPIKLLEYLAMAKPVIVTDMPVFRNVIGAKKCGIFINSNHPQDIARAIAFCYENKKKLMEWGIKGRELVQQKYTWRRQAITLANFLNNLINQ